MARFVGHRKDETVGKMAEEHVTLLASTKMLENVLVKSLGLSCVPLLLVIAISPLVGGAKRDEDDKASERSGGIGHTLFWGTRGGSHSCRHPIASGISRGRSCCSCMA